MAQAARRISSDAEDLCGSGDRPWPPRATLHANVGRMRDLRLLRRRLHTALTRGSCSPPAVRPRACSGRGRQGRAGHRLRPPEPAPTPVEAPRRRGRRLRACRSRSTPARTGMDLDDLDGLEEEGCNNGDCGRAGGRQQVPRPARNRRDVIKLRRRARRPANSASGGPRSRSQGIARHGLVAFETHDCQFASFMFHVARELVQTLHHRVVDEASVLQVDDDVARRGHAIDGALEADVVAEDRGLARGDAGGVRVLFADLEVGLEQRAERGAADDVSSSLVKMPAKMPSSRSSPTVTPMVTRKTSSWSLPTWAVWMNSRGWPGGSR